MANVSDVYDIEFMAQSEEVAKALFAYAKKLEESPCEYNLTTDAELNGTTVKGNWASGRWVYSSNLEGYFERPHDWCDDDAHAEYQKLVSLLKKTGEEIGITYSEDEPGCVIHQDGAGSMIWNKELKNLSISLDFEEHDPPCDIVDAEDSGFEDDNTEKLPFYCYAHEQFTKSDDVCEGAK